VDETAKIARPSGLRFAGLAAAFLLLGAADAPASRADLVTIKEARSIAAEWALVNRLAADGRLRRAYVRAMREEAIGQLESALKAMKDKDSAAAAEIGALAHLSPNASAGLLYAHARRLQSMEDALEVR
jgi:hypothetical protein